MAVFLRSVLFFSFIFSISLFAQSESKPRVIGKTHLLKSKILNGDRIINVYLPQNYHPNDTTNYPVIYVLDGGMDEDFLHISGIVQFSTQPWIARFPRSIVVGIEGNHRRRDFTFGVENTDFIEEEGFEKVSFRHYGGSASYQKFLEEELQPFIEKQYGKSGKKTVIGESLAGLLATEILLKRPHLFDNYIIISPSLWWGERLLLKNARNLLQKNLKHPVKVYIGVPNKEEDLKMFDEAEALYQILKASKTSKIVFDYIPDESHATVIHQAVYNAFKKLN